MMRELYQTVFMLGLLLTLITGGWLFWAGIYIYTPHVDQTSGTMYVIPTYNSNCTPLLAIFGLGITFLVISFILGNRAMNDRAATRNTPAA